MIVVGTGGHAIEVFQVLAECGAAADCVFYNDLHGEVGPAFRGFRVLRSAAEARAELRRDRRVALAVGGPSTRRRLAEALRALGGELVEVRASSARVSSLGVELGTGLNIMHGVLVSGGAQIGEGALLNAACQVHHGVRVGRWSEVSPGALLLGDARLEDGVTIGANATILPQVRVGARAVVGAGAVVTRDVRAGATVAGVPARALEPRRPLLSAGVRS